MRMKKKTKVLMLIIVLFVVMVVLAVELFIESGFLFVRKSSFQVVEAEGKNSLDFAVYDLPDSNNLLLVVEDRAANKRVGFYVNMEFESVSIPSFSRYRPLFDSAVIHEWSLEGGPSYARYNTEFHLTKDKVKIQFKGILNQHLYGDSQEDKEHISWLNEYLLFGREIVLAKSK